MVPVRDVVGPVLVWNPCRSVVLPGDRLRCSQSKITSDLTSIPLRRPPLPSSEQHISPSLPSPSVLLAHAAAPTSAPPDLAQPSLAPLAQQLHAPDTTMKSLCVR